MVQLIRRSPSSASPIVDPTSGTLDMIYFDLVTIAEGETGSRTLEDHESLYVVLSGQVDIAVDGQRFEAVGQRQDIWTGDADAVYAPVGARVAVTGRSAVAEVAVAGAICDTRHDAFRVRPEEVDAVEVGSVETHSHRRIAHVLGQRQNGRCGRLLVSELYASHGCWSGYPPHKHDTENGDAESEHEELYHYRFSPETGFGAQFGYDAVGAGTAFITRHGDTFLLDRGYHPTVTSPGHRSYILTILAGRYRRGLVQAFEPQHAHLTGLVPGIDAMREKFR